MELRHFRYFLAVAEELSFSRGARRLHLSQPPLSQQIHDLEDELGAKLFHRNKRQVRLTEAGHLFLSETREILARAERAKGIVRRAAERQAASLVVGCSVSFDLGMIRGFEATFKRRFAGTRLVLHSYFTPEVVEALLDGRCDVGFLAMPVRAKGLSTIVIQREPLCVAIRESHPLAHYRQVPVAALAEYPLIWFNRKKNPAFYDHYLPAFRQTGLNVTAVQEADDRSCALSMAKKGDGFAFVSRSLLAVRTRGIAYRRVRPPHPFFWDVAMAYRREGAHKLALSFVETVIGLTSRVTQTPSG